MELEPWKARLTCDVVGLVGLVGTSLGTHGNPWEPSKPFGFEAWAGHGHGFSIGEVRSPPKGANQLREWETMIVMDILIHLVSGWFGQTPMQNTNIFAWLARGQSLLSTVMGGNLCRQKT